MANCHRRANDDDGSARRRGTMAPGYCHRRANDDGGSALPIAGFVAQAISGGRTATGSAKYNPIM